MRIHVVSVGRVRPPYADDVAHYVKLLRPYAQLELIEVRDPVRAAARVPEGAYTSLLAADGAVYDSHAFARFIDERRLAARGLAFVVGGADGIELERADHRLSLSSLTVAHQLARVVLLEQLYRAHRILAGEPYHR